MPKLKVRICPTYRSESALELDSSVALIPLEYVAREFGKRHEAKEALGPLLRILKGAAKSSVDVTMGEPRLKIAITGSVTGFEKVIVSTAWLPPAIAMMSLEDGESDTVGLVYVEPGSHQSVPAPAT